MRVRILCTILHMCMLYIARMQFWSIKMVKCSCSRSISKCFYKTFFYARIEFICRRCGHIVFICYFFPISCTLGWLALHTFRMLECVFAYFLFCVFDFGVIHNKFISAIVTCMRYLSYSRKCGAHRSALVAHSHYHSHFT